MGEAAGHSQTDDNSQTSSGGAANVRVDLVGIDKPLITALAFAAALVAILYSAWVDHDMTAKLHDLKIEAENYASDKRVVENHVMHLEAELDVLKKETTNANPNKPAGR